MKRLYYLCSDIDSADRISADMHNEGLNDWRFHIMSRDEQGLFKHQLHSASVFQRYDIVHSGEQGGIAGALAGAAICIFLIGLQNEPVQFSLTNMALLILCACLIGAWTGALSGSRHENYKIACFHEALEHNMYLIILDVRAHEESRVRDIMQRYHSEAPLAGYSSPFSNPFKSREIPTHLR